VRGILGLLVALIVAGGAAGATTDVTRTVGWHESWSLRGEPFMTFDVTSIDVSRGQWSARVAVRNDSRFPLTVPSRLFQLAIYASAHPVNCRAYTPLRGGLPDPLPPAVIKPGSVWRATFGGPHGLPPSQTAWARVVFAYFKGGPTAAMRQNRWGWITDHAVSLTTGRSVRAPLPC
jgi:hypothetical protein